MSVNGGTIKHYSLLIQFTHRALGFLDASQQAEGLVHVEATVAWGSLI